MAMTVGVDVGSTTVKIVILKNGELVYRQYERHMSQVRPKTLELLRGAKGLLETEPFTVALSGSAGLGMAKGASLPFIQEVFATGEVALLLAFQGHFWNQWRSEPPGELVSPRPWQPEAAPPTPHRSPLSRTHHSHRPWRPQANPPTSKPSASRPLSHGPGC